MTIGNILALGAVMLMSLTTLGAEIPFAKKINFTILEAQRLNLDADFDLIELVGIAKFGNSCKVKDFKFKTLSRNENRFEYSVFGSEGDSFGCPKIYLPVEKSFVIDRIMVDRNQPIEIFVNGDMVN